MPEYEFPYRNPALPIEQRVDDLLKRMTLDEKVDQLMQITVGADTNPNNLGSGHSFRPTIGSVLSYCGGTRNRNAFQRLAVEETRLGIPIIWGFDVIHGWRTAFPIPLAQACSWNPDIVEAGCRVAARESYAEGVDWTFSPMLDVPHDPRWGRVMEGYGEDPLAAGIFGAAAVRGYQGEDPSQPGTVAACLKHFVGYAASEAGHDYAYTDISSRTLHETYLPPFQAAVEAGAMTVMSSFNDITGTPAVINHYTLTEVLRNRWNFRGFVVSDWDGVVQLAHQGYTSDPEEMCRAALSAGNDMEMNSSAYRNIPALLESGRLKIEVVDEAVRRVLRIKFAKGLFEHPYRAEVAPETVSLQSEALELSREAARASMVLLKNEKNTLPLNPGTLRSIALIGPGVADRRAAAGAWSAAVDAKTIPSLQEVLPGYFPTSTIHYAPGCDYEGDSTEHFAEAVAAAEKSDLVIVALGEGFDRSGENRSYANIALPGKQLELLRKIAAVGRPVVLLVSSGRPILYPELEPLADAILHIWECGHGAAAGCCDILTGAYNPSGRLAITFPRSVGQIPIYYNHHPRARDEKAEWGGRYFDLDDSPMYPFGYGLSYTSYEYSDLEISVEDLTAQVTLRNTGKRAGRETVFWYLSDPEAKLTQPLRRLIAFEQVDLAPGEERRLTLQLDRMHDLAYIDPTGKKVFEPGRFILSVDGEKAEFVVAE